jgi:hypothetical protein
MYWVREVNHQFCMKLIRASGHRKVEIPTALSDLSCADIFFFFWLWRIALLLSAYTQTSTCNAWVPIFPVVAFHRSTPHTPEGHTANVRIISPGYSTLPRRFLVITPLCAWLAK